MAVQQYDGIIWYKAQKRGEAVTLFLEASQGPGKPPGGGGEPPTIWPGPGDPDYPIKPPGGGGGEHPAHPIALPGDPWWPKPPIEVPPMPPPGSPPVILPGTAPVHPITPPQAIVVDYPGIGKVLVPQPVPAS